LAVRNGLAVKVAVRPVIIGHKKKPQVFGTVAFCSF